MWTAAVVAPIQIVAGDLHGLNTLEHQPAKIAAMEGHFESQTGAPLYLFGWPDMEAEELRYAIGIPKLGSLILTHDPDGFLQGLEEWPREDRPNATVLFWTFRVMVAIGFAMVAIGLWALWRRWRGTLYEPGLLHRLSIVMGPSGFVAVLAGWVTTEMGRQPWTVYGLLRTADSASPMDAPAVATSLLAFIVVYFLVFGAGVYYVLRSMNAAPHDNEPGLNEDQPVRAAGLAQAGTPASGIAGED